MVQAPSDITTPEAYIAWAPAARQADLRALHELITAAAPSLTPAILHGMIGYGVIRYRSRSGCEGEWFTIGLANQKQHLSLYFCACDGDGYMAEKAKDRLGRVTVGKSCVRFRQLSDLNLDVVEELIRRTQANAPVSYEP